MSLSRFDQCCFLGSESDVYLRSLYWWFLVIAVCLLQAGIPGNLHWGLLYWKLPHARFLGTCLAALEAVVALAILAWAFSFVHSTQVGGVTRRY